MGIVSEFFLVVVVHVFSLVERGTREKKVVARSFSPMVAALFVVWLAAVGGMIPAAVLAVVVEGMPAIVVVADGTHVRDASLWINHAIDWGERVGLPL